LLERLGLDARTRGPEPDRTRRSRIGEHKAKTKLNRNQSSWIPRPVLSARKAGAWNQQKKSWGKSGRTTRRRRSSEEDENGEREGGSRHGNTAREKPQIWEKIKIVESGQTHGK
jgi:hypothetical protein